MANELVKNIEYNLDRLLNGFVSGSNAIRVKDILDTKQFQLHFRWKTYIGGVEQINDIHTILVPSNNKSSLVKKNNFSRPWNRKINFDI